MVNLILSMKMKKYIYLSLFTFVLMLTACSSLDESGVAETVSVDGQNIRMHATIKGNTRISVPSDTKTDWVSGDMIFMQLDGGNGKLGIKATYDGTTWNFAEWYKNGGMPDFNAEGGTVSFAMIGDNLNLTTLDPSKLISTNTTLTTLTSYVSSKKIGDIMSTNAGTYTVDENGIVDIYLNFERPMAKIHILGAYANAIQIRNQIEGAMPSGTDNVGGTNENYNKAKSMTLSQIIRYQPSSQSFRDAMLTTALNGTANMVYETRTDDPQIVDAVYYGNMDPDENGDITIVMCTNARTYTGIEANAALGSSGMVAYWRKFPSKTINPGDNIYIYGPMSEEEATLWTSQAISGEMNFTQSELTLAENQQVVLKPYCKWKAPAPSNRTLTFTVADPSIVSISEDGTTLSTLAKGSTTITSRTADGYESTMTVNVKEVQELIDVTLSTWGSSFTTTNNVGWIFFNNTVVDLTVTRVAMIVSDEEVAYADDLSLLARTNGSTSGALKIKEDDVAKLSSSVLRITYTYNGNSYTVDIPFKEL